MEEDLFSAIYGSYTIRCSYFFRTRRDMRERIQHLRILNPNNLALQRPTESLIREWCAHNLLYNMHLFRSHTRDVDFEARPKWYATTAWFILSLFYWH